MNTYTLKRLRFFVLILCCLWVLTGCFKSDVTVDINLNGSGTVSIAYGLTVQAKDLLAAQGTKVADEINKSLTLPGADPLNVVTTSWVDGEYDWTMAKNNYKSVDEINTVMHANRLFKSFSLVRSSGILQDEFILSAELAPLSAIASSGSSTMDNSGLMQMRFLLNLPGDIKETNGVADEIDPEHLSWKMQKEVVSVTARSVSWNITNLVLLVVAGVMVLIVLIGAWSFTSTSRQANRPKRRR